MTLRRGLYVSFVLSITLCATGAEAQGWSCSNCFADVSAGYNHGCATRQDGSVTCWGSDSEGQSTPPELDPDMYSFLEVSAGRNHTCARTKCTATFPTVCPPGNIRCWGLNDDGQTSGGASTVYKSIDAGGYHTCGLTPGNDIECWGLDQDGQSTVPTPPTGYRYTQVSAGANHTCATLECESGLCLLRTNVSCWGLNDFGQTDVPGFFPDFHTFTQISAGWYHNCGVKTDGTVLCWGNDGSGESTPPAGTFQQVSTGLYHTCGLRTDGTIVCWGLDSFGQTTPPAGTFVEVTSGEFLNCGMRPSHSVVCWGQDNYNQTLPTAGRCGLFDADFEVGGDCRWSNGSVPCWTADCDGDGYVSDESTTICSATMPMLLPPDCLGGDWVQQTATCGAFDCKDDNPDVHAGQSSWYIHGYGSAGGPATLLDYNCDGVEEKLYTSFASNVCCSWNGESCIAVSLPTCDPPGWDSNSVTEVPDCAEVEDYRWCIEFSPGFCTEKVAPITQMCR